jgi:hypothetical protein
MAATKSIAPRRTQERWAPVPDADTPGSYPFNVVNYMLVLAARSQVRDALSVFDGCETKDLPAAAFRFLHRALEDLDVLKTRLDRA